MVVSGRFGVGALGERGEAQKGLGGVPFRGRDGRGRGVAEAIEVAVGGEVVDVPAGGEDAQVGFEAALETGEGGVVGEQFGEGTAGAGDLVSEGGGCRRGRGKR